MPMFEEEIVKQLSGILQDLNKPIKMVCFLGTGEKNEEARQFVNEFSGFSDKITLVIHDDSNKDLMSQWNAQMTPAIFVTDQNETNKGVGFFGTPGGYEINSLLIVMLEVSGKVEPFDPAHKKVLEDIKEPKEIYGFISLTCPLCPQAIMNIHRLAIENHNIKAYMVEGPAFKDYSDEQGISAFPTIKIGAASIVGENAKDMDKLIEMLKNS